MRICENSQKIPGKSEPVRNISLFSVSSNKYYENYENENLHCHYFTNEVKIFIITRIKTIQRFNNFIFPY